MDSRIWLGYVRLLFWCWVLGENFFENRRCGPGGGHRSLVIRDRVTGIARKYGSGRSQVVVGLVVACPPGSQRVSNLNESNRTKSVSFKPPDPGENPETFFSDLRNEPVVCSSLYPFTSEHLRLLRHRRQSMFSAQI